MKTERLYLRERTTELLSEVFSKQEEDQYTFFGHQDSEMLRKEKKAFEMGFNNWRMSCKLWDLLLLDSSEVIGHCGYHSWYQAHNRAEIGYALHTSFKGKGYMSEAMHSIIEFGFGSMELHRIEACIGPTNKASLNLVRKFGFQKEGLMREHYLRNGIYEDSEMHRLLKSEFQKFR
ncbi:MAG: GNAT family N-acetyltransferase [Flavobacteriales bacterium]|nr:GNAT family N-acetyltransferase [Flavobacteriales bacterium]